MFAGILEVSFLGDRKKRIGGLGTGKGLVYIFFAPYLKKIIFLKKA
ncbi:MAG: hypothetical protein GTO45_20545 [Candidatus Aminicenantes bacterium]|nr:hypothetical protein [Candidatus Aminicenantes bacterium]NIM81178.1 hypothetical protein [Candidatus Aminicenantes bacterium]NIN20553.1 hypothetical protein [Candidatus Aminicenantes bacterium]NIN44332.1 hypothetical protein [Candidatus Aminicenantes bacterium]NIN87151.1 hypothetical protein [Candidatus Aminicenantes bacterium]